MVLDRGLGAWASLARRRLLRHLLQQDIWAWTGAFFLSSLPAPTSALGDRRGANADAPLGALPSLDPMSHDCPKATLSARMGALDQGRYLCRVPAVDRRSQFNQSRFCRNASADPSVVVSNTCSC